MQKQHTMQQHKVSSSMVQYHSPIILTRHLQHQNQLFHQLQQLPIPTAPTEAEGTDEDNQSHLSGSEGDGHAEESLLTPDEQDISVVPKQTLEKHPSADTNPHEQDISVVSMTLEKHPSAESTPSEQEVPAAAAAPRRSKRNVKKVNLKLLSK